MLSPLLPCTKSFTLISRGSRTLVCYQVESAHREGPVHVRPRPDSDNHGCRRFLRKMAAFATACRDTGRDSQHDAAGFGIVEMDDPDGRHGGTKRHFPALAWRKKTGRLAGFFPIVSAKRGQRPHLSAVVSKKPDAFFNSIQLFT